MFDDPVPWWRLVVASLAVWRLTQLLAREDGPGEWVARGRAALGQGLWGRMVACFHCLSLWVAAPAAWWVAPRLDDALWIWLALSGAACLLDRLGQPELVLQPLPDTPEGEPDGMLRSKP